MSVLKTLGKSQKRGHKGLRARGQGACYETASFTNNRNATLMNTQPCDCLNKS